MSWTHVQSGKNWSIIPNLQVVLGSPTPAGNLVVACATKYNAALTSIDDGVNTWHKAAALLVPGYSFDVELWYTVVTSPGTLTITANGPSYSALIVDEFSATGTITADGSNTNSGHSTSASSGNATVSALDLVVAACGPGAATPTPDGAYSQSADDYIANNPGNVIGLAVEYLLDTTTTPAAPTFALSSAQDWIMVAASFQIPAPISILSRRPLTGRTGRRGII